MQDPVGVFGTDVDVYHVAGEESGGEGEDVLVSAYQMSTVRLSP